MNDFKAGLSNEQKEMLDSLEAQYRDFDQSLDAQQREIWNSTIARYRIYFIPKDITSRKCHR